MAATKPTESEDGGELARLARRLSDEFKAPVGMLDPSSGAWLAGHGLPEHGLPPVNPEAVRAMVGGAGAAIELWRPEGGEPRAIWLLLPIATTSGPAIAAAAFAVAPEASARLGPVCPEPALRAWGREVAARYRNPAETRSSGAGEAELGSVLAPVPARPGSDGGDGIVLARLIRRFRIADAASRFQQLACNALRTALNAQAVAWVPCHQADPVIAIGEVGRLKGNDFRTFIPAPVTALVRLVNLPGESPRPEVKRMIAVSADSHGTLGWLMALNPLVDRPFTAADAELLQPVASLIATQQTNARVYADLKELLFGVIRALTAAIDAKDPYTCGHSERVARIAVRLAEELGMPAAQRSDLYLMGLLHDVGKIGVDDAVLKKPGPLTPDEYRQIQRHVEIGVQILHDLKKLGHLLPGVRHHHESLDGSGYPCGLAGDAIPYEARILAVADSYDAMSSTRPYRRRLTPMQIDEILRKGAGVQWDPKIIDALFAVRMDLEMIRQKGLGESLQVAVSGALGRP